MYVPKQFQNKDAATIKDFIRHHGFGILVTPGETRLTATHIPLQFSDDENSLLGHISRANPQWKKFTDDTGVMVIFPGPHAYISSSWYDHENVPTWNYIAVHVYGRIKIIEGDQLHNALKHLVDKYEAGSEHPVSVDKMSPEYVRRSIQGLVGFEITITSMEAAYKLSQNRDKTNHTNVVDQLEKRGDAQSQQVADAMKKHAPDFN